MDKIKVVKILEALKSNCAPEIHTKFEGGVWTSPIANKYYDALTSAISDLRAYQELKGRINVEKIGEILRTSPVKKVNLMDIDDVKHKLFASQAQAIVNYLGGKE